MKPASPPATPKPASGATPVAAGGQVPQHVAIIMDGNGRWAQSRGLLRPEGHRAGTENVRPVLRSFVEHGVKYLTLFAFSTENWERPDDEVGALIELLGEVLRRETQPLHEEGVRLRHVGRLDRLPQSLQDSIKSSMELTKDNDVLTLSLAYDYGGRHEILEAVRSILAEHRFPEEITEETFGRYLYTHGLPDVDLIIRTAGEMRLSNFLLWQSHYAEYYSTDAYWPDFNGEEVRRALESYARRKRRYGRVDPAEQS